MLARREMLFRPNNNNVRGLNGFSIDIREINLLAYTDNVLIRRLI